MDTSPLACVFNAMTTELAIYWSFEVARWLWNLALLRLHPFLVAIGTEVLDQLDDDLWRVANGDIHLYKRYDKLADVTFYISAFIYTVYFMDCLRWPRGVLWLIVGFLAYRIVGNFLIIGMPSAAWLTLVFPNIGGLLFTVYSGLDFFRLNRRLEGKTGWHAFIVIVVICAKYAEEALLYSQADGYAMAPHCTTMAGCFGIWTSPAVGFFFLVIWAGYMRWPDWYKGTVQSRHGVYVKI